MVVLIFLQPQAIPGRAMMVNQATVTQLENLLLVRKQIHLSNIELKLITPTDHQIGLPILVP
jgi:hypothetical protein